MDHISWQTQTLHLPVYHKEEEKYFHKSFYNRWHSYPHLTLILHWQKQISDRS